MPYRPPNYGGSYGGYDSSPRILDLIMRQGQIQAERAQASGNIWGNALAGLGQIAGGAITAHGEEKARKKQSIAFEAAIQSGDPRQIISVLGPERGPAVINALRTTTPDAAKIYKDRMELFRDGARGLLASPEDMRPQGYAFLRQSYLQNGFAKPEELPESFEEALPLINQAANYGREPAKPQALQGFAPNTTVIDPATGQTVLTTPAAPREERRHMVTVPGSDGRPVQRLATEEELATGVTAYREPRAPRDPRLVQVDTVGADGKPVTKFVEPSAGASYPKPTGAGKPATGQQRRALGFLNRGKEAQEIASALEEGNTINPASIKYTPEIANFALSDANQAYQQAQRAFTEARLRKDSGAAVPEHEYETDALTYFAQPGDSAATKAQKRAGRNAILAGLAFESGDALREFYGDEAETMLAEYKRLSDRSETADPLGLRGGGQRDGTSDPLGIR